ncbi:VCBS repeat-containing protein [Dyadobacter sp. CY345]|uniref:VCBS repeat-containing protein n=1 Tax=Dyadobacter sp. CY345 TaxID=2909335 RepID=UPI001F43B772|nr:VCBS repeat-containing protein [Dyadobacter sp. CY345]MCF2443013.1 VCBS repeat-containing protein [Dyadobacter sp. CY345]
MSVRYLLLLFLVIPLLNSCKKKLKTFTMLDSEETGINFSNRIAENDTMNILAFEYVYNGGGVALGDFNNDSLPDIYFTGNSVDNKLYLNKGADDDGGLRFEDVTKKAGVAAENKWSSGVALIDINNDGLLDIYVCSTVRKVAKERENLLYVNQGMGADKVPVFKEMGKEYGVADTTHTTNAAFLDYDNDGDLDLFLVVNEMDDNNFPNKFHEKIIDGSSKRTDRLYRNDWDKTLGHPVFTNVSKDAGILIEGYGLGVNVTDVNQDGWKDIYVTNDYLTNDLLYINNGKDAAGKHLGFTNMADAAFKHTSHSAMGNDVADINNDGLPDIVALDMMPATNFRKKMMTPASSYITYQNYELYHYQYQVARNTLQLNLGKTKKTNKSPVFSEIGLLSGIAETDWSWTPMVTDFDNDGLRDIIITNGFPRDITDMDFIAYRNEVGNVMTKMMLLDYVPSVKIKNFAYKNKGNLRFEDVTDDWGIELPGFSNGAAYADLDNDGDLDYVVNNINDSAAVYRNNSIQLKPEESNYLRIKFKGEGYNGNGIGAVAGISYNGSHKQYAENSPFRGYLSTVEPVTHFGLGKVKTIDKLVVTWTGGKTQTLRNVKANQVLTVYEKNAKEEAEPAKAVEEALMQDITELLDVKYRHEEQDNIDFNVQKLLPHKLSQYGPALAVGDVNGDKLDDVFIGGAMFHKGRFLLQQPDGKFVNTDLLPGADGPSKNAEDMGVLLFDADLDEDLDLYIVSGSYEMQANSDALQDRLYINNGKGQFSQNASALPKFLKSGSCVKAADYDRDGDLDLFIGGRVEPGAYPKPVSSYLLRNDSAGGQVKFTDVTKSIAPELINIGLVCDVLWTDFDNDGWVDLLAAGEWMPLTFFKNVKGTFKKHNSGLENQKGLWGTLATGDFDNDGDMDYLAGNLGLNSLNRASDKQPIGIYAKDINKDGFFDAIPTVFYKGKDGSYKEFPYNTRDEMGKQIIQVRQRFQEYGKFSDAGIKDIFKPDELKDALMLKANWLKSSYVENLGGGKFKVHELPVEAQFAPLFSMVTEDIDGDGNLDVMLCGNDFGSDVSVGRYDAFNGLILKGNGKGGFGSLSCEKGGYMVTGNAKAMVKLSAADGKLMTITSQNKDSLRFHQSRSMMKSVPLLATENTAILKLKNGKIRREEINYGSSFLSQSAHKLLLPDYVLSAEIIDAKGEARIVK